MYDEAMMQEVLRREGDAEARVSPQADTTTDPDAGRDAAWRSGLVLIAELQGLGFSHNTICEASATIAEVREEFARERTEQPSATG